MGNNLFSQTYAVIALATDKFGSYGEDFFPSRGTPFANLGLNPPYESDILSYGNLRLFSLIKLLISVLFSGLTKFDSLFS